MALRLPLSVRLDRRAVARRDAFFACVLRAVRPPPAAAAEAIHAFAFKNDEGAFARALLERHSRLWLFRGNQRAFCGDFVVVDMSSPRPASRRAVVIELKRGSALSHGGGGAGVQLVHAERAVRDPAGVGAVLGGEAAWEMVSGDGARVLDWLGVARGAAWALRALRGTG